MVRVVVFGMGHLGRWHVDKAVALPDAELVGVVDPDKKAKEKLTERNLGTPLYPDLKHCLAECEFDAAIVATPTSLHFDLCNQLLDGGKHIFCEKPMTSTLEEAQALEKKAKEKDIIFQVGHSERYHSIWDQVKEKNHYFSGSPSFQLQRRAPFKGRATDVDVVQDLMIHDLDLLLYLFQERPSKIKAVGKKMRTDKWDFVRAFLEYDSGAHATISVGRNYTHEIREFEVVNEKGVLHVDLFARSLKEAPSSAESEFVKEQSYERRDHLLEEQQLFYGAILGKNEPVVTIKEGREAVALVSKVLLSLERGEAISL